MASNDFLLKRLRNGNEKRTRNYQFLEMATSVKWIAIFPAEVPTIYSEETAKHFLSVFHHPGFCLDKFMSKTTFLKAC